MTTDTNPTTEPTPSADLTHQPMLDEYGQPRWFDVAKGLTALQLPGGILTAAYDGQGRTTFVPGVVLVPSATSWGRASIAAAPVPSSAAARPVSELHLRPPTPQGVGPSLAPVTNPYADERARAEAAPQPPTDWGWEEDALSDSDGTTISLAAADVLRVEIEHNGDDRTPATATIPLAAIEALTGRKLAPR